MGRQPPKVHNLEYHRQRCGYTQVEIAELLNISRSTWHGWVREASRPRLTHQYRLAQLWHPVSQQGESR
jgi:DNA-binding XRE family transcriptional regulator